MAQDRLDLVRGRLGGQENPPGFRLVRARGVPGAHGLHAVGIADIGKNGAAMAEPAGFFTQLGLAFGVTVAEIILHHGHLPVGGHIVVIILEQLPAGGMTLGRDGDIQLPGVPLFGHAVGARG